MNRISIFCLLAILNPASCLLAELTWDRKHLEQALIYVSAAPQQDKKRPVARMEHPYLHKAAEDLKDYLRKMTGVEVPIVEVDRAASIPNGRPAFILGPLAVELGAQPPATLFHEDGYIIVTRNNQLLLAGEDAPGTAYAVADFLHQQGVRWYMPGPYGEEAPKRDHLTLPETPIKGAPSYEDRVLWYNGGKANKFPPNAEGMFGDWLRRNRIAISMRLPAGHMWNNIFRAVGPGKNAGENRKEFFKNHPEYFGIVNGVPAIGQLNLGSDAVVDLFVNYYKSLLKEAPRDIQRVFSISPDDGVILNENPESKPFITRRDLTFSNLPDSTDLVIQFLNRVVTRLNEEYPNVKLAFYIYSNYQNGPTSVKMNANLIPFIAPLNFSRYHALNDATKPSRTMLASIVKRWHASGATFGWRDYSFLCPDALMPFTRMHMTPRELPWLYERGCRYYNTETTINWPNLLPEYYLITRILWDVKVDQSSIIQEFYARFFGAAGDSMKAYIDELSQAYDSLPFASGNKEFVDSVFTSERSAKLRGLMEKAKAAVAGDDIRIHRVKIMETALNQSERFMQMRAAVNAFDYEKAQQINLSIHQAFLDDQAFDPHTNNQFVKDVWYERFYGKHVGQVAEWLNDAEVVHLFADEWPAHFDLTSTGELEGLSNPATTAFAFHKLKTWSRSLAEQGWEKFRGDLWYRQTFPAIKVPEGKKLYLVFGGVASDLKAWIDGEAVGEAKTRDAGPLLLPLEALKNQDTHTLTLKISNRTIAELGVGGLIRPVALVIK